MKSLLQRSIFYMLAFSLFALYPAFSQREGPRIAGRWRNIDPNTRGITQIAIDIYGRVQLWGKCYPTDCMWDQDDSYGGYIVYARHRDRNDGNRAPFCCFHLYGDPPIREIWKIYNHRSRSGNRIRRVFIYYRPSSPLVVVILTHIEGRGGAAHRWSGQFERY